MSGEKPLPQISREPVLDRFFEQACQAGANIFAELSNKPIEDILSLFRRKRTEELLGNISGRGKYKFLKVQSDESICICDKHDIRRILRKRIQTWIPNRKIREKATQLLDGVIVGDFKSTQSVVGSSVRGKFSFYFIDISFADCEGNFYQLAMMSSHGELENYPDIDIVRITKEDILCENSRIEFRKRDRPVEPLDILVMWKLMTGNPQMLRANADGTTISTNQASNQGNSLEGSHCEGTSCNNIRQGNRQPKGRCGERGNGRCAGRGNDSSCGRGNGKNTGRGVGRNGGRGKFTTIKG